ncbi:MAG: hypothetical protein AAF754_10465 [Pseudomonadota bacterium]
MTSNNKILTVSYGTFSCTLEGFEDSFETMKTIAEYFRDLAQEDRYFGAEPAQPDANLLARIAEKEIARHVDAKSDENGIHLRAATPAIAATAALASAVPDADDKDAVRYADDEPADIADVAVPDDIAPPTDPEAKAEADDIGDAGDEVSEHLEVIAQEDSGETDITETETVETDTPSQTEADPDATSILAVMTQQEDTGTIDEPGDLAALSDEPVDSLSEFAEVTEVDAEPVEEPLVADAYQDTSIASRLQAIRAVVAKSDDAPMGYSEDQHAEEIAGQDDGDIEATFGNDDDVSAHDPDEVTDIPEDQDLDATIASALADFSDEDETETSNAADEDGEVASVKSSEQTESDLADLIPEIDALDGLEIGKREEDEPLDLSAIGTVLAKGSEDSETDTSAEFVEIDAEDLTELESVLNLDEIDVVSAEADTEDTTPAGRVIMVKKSDLEAALENGMLEEIDEDTQDPELSDPNDVSDVSQDAASNTSEEADPEFAPESSLSDEDEADLMRELDAVESELNQDFDAETDELEDASAHDAVARFQELNGTEEDELDRLMAEADNQMEEPEGKDRRSAFSHLRGAVVATKSDDKLSEEAAGTIENEDDYRTDLAAAVRPRRPVSSGGGARPQAERPAPLKLVAAQRIDDSSDAMAAPVRPRRVEATEIASGDTPSGSFSDYVEAQGARELSELLEAAASYLSFVEGRDQFSRPQLMTKVRQVGHEEFTREAGLRSFGQLLRSGKIEKIKGGRFTVSQEIGFRPEERQAG